jgi:hypothetical protein
MCHGNTPACAGYSRPVLPGRPGPGARLVKAGCGPHLGATSTTGRWHGHVDDPNYLGQLPLWQNQKPLAWPFTREAGLAAAKNTLVLTPTRWRASERRWRAHQQKTASA